MITVMSVWKKSKWCHQETSVVCGQEVAENSKEPAVMKILGRDALEQMKRGGKVPR